MAAGQGWIAKVQGWFRRDVGDVSPQGYGLGSAAGRSDVTSTQDGPLAKGGYVGALPGMMTGTSGSQVYDAIRDSLHLAQEIAQRYADADDMDAYPELASALTVYADDATVPDSSSHRTIWASARDRTVRGIVDDLVTRRLRQEDDVHGVVRGLAKYGNMIGEILVGQQGVVGINYLAPATVRRVHDERGQVLGFVQDISGAFRITQKQFDEALRTPRDQRKPIAGCVVFEPWEIVHWRLRDRDMRAPYGIGVLDAARWAWKRLLMLEDTAVVGKLTRAPGRYAYYIDTGDLPPAEAMAHVQRMKNAYQRKKVVNPDTGQLDFRYNAISPHEDLWLPTRGGKDSTRVDVINGVDAQDMDVLEYFRTKVIAATLVPKRFLGLEEGAQRQLSQDDVRFARSVMRLQREYRNGMKQVARVHLAALGVDPDAATFDMHMTVPSYVFELAQLEVRNGQAQLAQALGELMPKPWILQHIFGFSQDEAIYTTKTKATEVSTAAKADAATQAEIMRVYPEVAIGVPPSMMGAMGMGGEDEGMGEDEAPAAPAATTKEDVGDLKRRLAVLLGENARVLRLVESLDHKVDDMAASERKRARRMRVIGGE